jgi:hypothetical protein
MRVLEDLEFVRTVADPGKPAIYVPHAVGQAVRIPQSLFRQQPPPKGQRTEGIVQNHLTKAKADGRFVLDGRALLLFLYGASELHTRGMLASRESQLALPMSARQLRAALRTLHRAALITRFRVVDDAWVAWGEPIAVQ